MTHPASLLPDALAADFTGKTVLLRADLNIALVDGGDAGPTRITRCANTVRLLLERGARVVILAHLDRPRGIANPVLSLAPVGRMLSRELDREVGFVPDCIGAVAEGATRNLGPGRVLLLENLRFHTGEEANDRAFALLLSVHGDVYVNDAPACSTRRHASIVTLPTLMPAYAGPHLLARAADLGAEADQIPGIAALVPQTLRLETA